MIFGVTGIRRLLAVAWVAALAGSVSAHAQDYPSRGPVTLVTGLAPGSITDVIARYLGSKLSQLSGQTFIIVNKVGANGIIAATEVARSKPDGYTLMWATSSAYVSNQLMYKSMTYDPLKDFVIISTVTQYGFILLVNADTPVSSVAELTAYLKKKGGGVYGATNTNMLAAIEMYKVSAGLGDTQQVRYKSAEQSVRELSIRWTLSSSMRRMRWRRQSKVASSRSRSLRQSARFSLRTFRQWMRRA